MLGEIFSQISYAKNIAVINVIKLIYFKTLKRLEMQIINYVNQKQN